MLLPGFRPASRLPEATLTYEGTWPVYRRVQLTQHRLAIDLPEQTITTPEREVIRFEIDGFLKHCLVNGLDEIGLTLRRSDAIKTFEEKHKASQPWLFT